MYWHSRLIRMNYDWKKKTTTANNPASKQSNESKTIKYKPANMKAKPQIIIIINDNYEKTKRV